jgi:hypothetical protein
MNSHFLFDSHPIFEMEKPAMSMLGGFFKIPLKLYSDPG